MSRKNNNTSLVSRSGNGNLVSSHVQDHYTLKHSRTTTNVYKDSNNQRYSVQEKTISTATQQHSYNAKSNKSGLAIAGPSSHTTHTQYTTTTYKGPGNERYVESNRDYRSNIQKSSYNGPNRGGGDVVRYGRGY